ncbi:MAG TPA: hypothetical protein VN982_17425 [Candidatus Dormibacteraeota bacterium]|nr:hypothetical protein [Candidatus Dormibacteraeota bacterium]
MGESTLWHSAYLRSVHPLPAKAYLQRWALQAEHTVVTGQLGLLVQMKKLA